MSEQQAFAEHAHETYEIFHSPGRFPKFQGCEDRPIATEFPMVAPQCSSSAFQPGSSANRPARQEKQEILPNYISLAPRVSYPSQLSNKLIKHLPVGNRLT
jgi:hypothetical protein